MEDKIEKSNVHEIFELNMVQKGMLYHYLRESDEGLYNVQLMLSIDGGLDIETFERSLYLVQSNNDVLRSVFRWEKVTRPLQIILNNCPIDFTYLDISQLDNIPNRIRSYLVKDQNQRFDLTKLPFRAHIIKVSDSSHMLIITHHHILYDGWSTGILLKEIFQNYNKINNNHAYGLNAKPGYKELYKALKTNAKTHSAKKYWKAYLKDYELKSIFSKNHTGAVLKGKMKKYHCNMPSAKINNFASENKVTKAVLIYVAYGILLQKYNNTSDIVFGTTVSDRGVDLPGHENVMGNFINTIPLRIKDLENASLLRVINKVNQQLIERSLYNYTSYFEIKDVVNLKSTDNLFDSLVVVENYPLDETSINDNNHLRIQLKSVYENASFPLALTVFFKDKLEVEVIYKEGFIDQETASGIAKHFFKILNYILLHPQKKVSDISLLTTQEEQLLLDGFNNTKVDYPKKETIISLFEKQVSATPDRTALMLDSQRVSYRELNAYSNAIANRIRAKVPKGNHNIGILFAPSVDMIASMLGVMKAGCAYVPLSPSAPLKRNKHILIDCAAKLLLIKHDLSIGYHINQLIDTNSIIEVNANDNNKCANVNFEKEVGPFDLIYVIYTSGTTGASKGVEVMHRGLVNYISWRIAEYDFTPKDVTLQLVSYCFDGYGANLYASLLSGGRLVLMTEKEMNPQGIASVLKKEKITHISLPPSILSLFLSELEAYAGSLDLRLVVIAGEKASRGLLEKSARILPDVALCNEYGPTETSVGATFNFDLNKNNASIIGKPIHNTTIYILGKNNELLPVGINGELYIGGVGLAKGYVNNKGLTNEKFIDSPFMPGERIYNTGDLACWLPDGNIRYLGRVDNQVKIRGYRIELEEIENQLNDYEHINETIVVTNENRFGKYLAAYYTAKTEQSAVILRNYLLERLPEYMVPHYYIYLETFPLSQNGKLDKKALPSPELAIKNFHIAPRNQKEKKLASVWSEVLEIDNVGIADNFFLIGGDSIKSIQISARMRGEGYDVSVKDIFNFPTIEGLSTKLKPLTSDSDQSLITGKVDLTPIQRWFFELPLEDRHHFNQSVLLNFPHGITEEMVRKMFGKLLGHHDALRIVFPGNDDKFLQFNHGLDLPLSLEVFDLTNDPAPENAILKLSNSVQSSIDLQKGPLVKLGLFHTYDGSRLLIVVHHLVVDSMSWRILYEDLENLYQQCLKNQPLTLPLKTDSFQSWSRTLSTHAENTGFLKTIAYWNEVSQAKVKTLTRDNPEGDNLIKNHLIESFKLTERQTRQILGKVHRSFNTQINDILLVALLISIHKKYGHKKVKIDLEGHGREEINTKANVSRTVGWFTSIYPLILEYQEDSLTLLIKQVKETLRAVPNNGFDYLLIKQLDAFNSELKDGQPAQISFNYLGQFGSDISNNSFSIAREDKGLDVSPNMVSHYDWSFVGKVENHQLELTIRYSKNQYNRESIIALMDLYRKSLIEVLNYCCNCTKIDLSPSDLTYKRLTIAQVNDLQATYDIQDVYALSPMQEGMIFHAMRDIHSDQYFEQKRLTLKGKPNISAIEKSLNDLILRYDVLRTFFLYKGYQQPLQVVLKERNVEFTYLDIRAENPDKPAEKVVEEYQRMDRAKKFDLEKDVLLRVTLIQKAEDEFEFIWSQHHIIMDGWCTDIIWKDFKTLYSNCINSDTQLLPPVKKYSSYIRWLENHNTDQSQNYWKNYIADYGNLATIPKIDEGATKKLSYNLKSLELRIDKMQTRQLQKFSRRCGITLNTLFQSAWGILLSRYNDTNDVVFGAVVSGRPSEIDGIESMVGLFINTIPVRINVKKGTAVKDLLKEVQTKAVKSEAHHYFSLSGIQSMSPLGGGMLDHVMIFENLPVTDKIEDILPDKKDVGGFEVVAVNTFEQNNYDLSVIIIPGEQICLRLDYNSNQYQKEIIQQVLFHFQNIIEEILFDDEKLISDIPMLETEEKKQLLNNFRKVKPTYENEETIVGLFERQTDKTPDHVAVVFEKSKLTYRELDEQSNRLALYLQRKGVKPDELVAVCMTRSSNMIVAIMGILKAGGAYVPIDPEYPEERIKYILQDSEVALLITENSLENKLSSITLETGLTYVLFDGKWTLANNDYQRLEKKAFQHHLAYAIYTSGSTGMPKGVLVKHSNVSSLLKSTEKQFNFGEKDIWTFFHSYCFDFSVWEIFGCLCYGGTLITVSYNESRSPEKFLQLLKERKVTVLNQTPSAFYQLLDEMVQQSPIPRLPLRYVIFGGEAINPTRLRAWFDIYRQNGPKLINMYGITETTVHVTYFELSKQDTLFSKSIIGRGIDSLKIYILDQNLRLLPKGASGEMYICGDGVSKGYLNRPGLTKRRFIDNPFLSGTKLYATGDLARWLPDNQLEYLGRIDNQVKIRGYRIELGEIESKLGEYDGISETVSVARVLDGSKYIAAYYVSPEKLDAEALRCYLSAYLPDYMVPKYYVHLEKIPLTSNGKLDKKSLPDPKIELTDGQLLPANDSEKKLASIWSDVLKADKEVIGVDRNFFAIGGDSIKAIRLLSAINKEFDVHLELTCLFENPTIHLQSEYIENIGNDDPKEVVTTPVNKKIAELKQTVVSTFKGTDNLADVYPMSDIEKGMFFHSFLNVGEAIYHDQFVYNISWGNFDFSLLRKAMGLIVQKHSILRTSFNLNGFEEPISIVHKSVEPAMGFEDISPYPVHKREDIIESFMELDRKNTFDHEIAPLWRVKVYKTSPSNVCLLLIFHHAILDGWSVASLVTELNNVYLTLCSNPLYKLEPLKIDYKDYVVQEILAKQNEDIRNYWKQELEGLSKLQIRDFHNNSGKNDDIGQFQHNFPSGAYQKLIKYSHQNNIGIREICFSAYLFALKTLTNSTELLVGLVSNNRLAMKEGDEVLGCFLNSVPFKINIPASIKVPDLLKLVGNKMLELRKYQQLSFFEIQHLIGKVGSTENSLFDTIFNYVDFHIYDDAKNETEQKAPSSGEVEIQPYEKTNTDIDFTVSTFKQSLIISIAYSGSKYSGEYINRFFYFFEQVLNRIIDNVGPTLLIADMIPPEEKKELVYSLNNTISDYPRTKTLIQLFDERVEYAPNSVALRFEGQQLSYQQLQEMSKKFASYLTTLEGISKGSVVGVMLGADQFFVISILGILRIGCTYVPISPDYPAERISLIIEDAGLSAIVLRDFEQINEKHEGLSVIDLNLVMDEIESKEVNLPVVKSRSTDIAYIIYTSGSTGKPKGTVITHYSVSRVVCNTNYIEIEPEDRILQLSNTAFDGSVFEIYGALLNGAELVLLSKETFSDIRKIGTLIHSEGISVMFITTALFNMLVEYSLDNLAGIRKILFGGEKVSVLHVEKALDYLGANKLVHVYGPTESTVFSTFHSVNQIDHKLGTIPIGLPISNTSVYVLEESLNIVPKGAIGEICIAGDGLAKGYLNQEALTNEKFRDHPFVSGERIYRTGDLGRRLSDGSIEFIGRIDDQVKIRGFRIELGEIESQLSAFEPINENRVLVIDDEGDKYLVAYYVSDKPVSVNDLKGHLSKHLPNYMIPSSFIHLGTLPLNSNGKLDKRALPEAAINVEEEYIAPTNKTEEQLVEIWSEVLKIGKSKIGIHTNFFEIGGHSINIIKLNYKVNEHFNRSISVASMFRLPTVAIMADYIENGDQSIERMSQEIDKDVAEAEDALSLLSKFSD